MKNVMELFEHIMESMPGYMQEYALILVAGVIFLWRGSILEKRHQENAMNVAGMCGAGCLVTALMSLFAALYPRGGMFTALISLVSAQTLAVSAIIAFRFYKQCRTNKSESLLAVLNTVLATAFLFRQAKLIAG